ncbi:MAG: hypothetical protein ABIA76_04885 [Candidatus Diapherotrites archaeon]
MFQIKLNSKGQAIFDLVFASFIFMLVLTMVISLYHTALVESNSLNRDELMQEKAFFAVERLLNSQGVPKNWHELSVNDINSIGLLNAEGIVSEDKLSAFINLGDYASAKEKFGIQNYEFYFYFSFSGDPPVQSGLPLDADLDSVVLRRIVPYKGGEAEVDFTVYQIWQ